MARSPVTGLTPLLASVAAIMARSRALTRIAALPEIEIEMLGDRLLDHAGVELQICNGAVSVTRRALRLEHFLVDRQLAAGVAAEHVKDAPNLSSALEP